jgi:hypothetical protein
MKQQRQSLIYTILADDMPIAAIEATGPEARELCKERWFIEELTQLKWMGQPLYPGSISELGQLLRMNGSYTTKKPARLKHLKTSCSSI